MEWNPLIISFVTHGEQLTNRGPNYIDAVPGRSAVGGAAFHRHQH